MFVLNVGTSGITVTCVSVPDALVLPGLVLRRRYRTGAPDVKMAHIVRPTEQHLGGARNARRECAKIAPSILKGVVILIVYIVTCATNFGVAIAG